MNKLWTEEEDRFLLQNYNKFQVMELANKLNRTIYSIRDRATKTLKIYIKTKKSNRTHNIDVNYFEKIDSPRKAYWYGFLWADGSVFGNKFEFTLQNQDKYIIENLKKDIRSSHKIFPHNKYNTTRFCFVSRDFVKCLNKLNITNRKSYSTLTPLIEDKYFKNFLLGLFDGDGCYTLKRFQIVCSKQVSIWLKEKILKHYGIECKIYKTQSVAVRLCINKMKEAKLVLEDLYLNNDLFLIRKNKKFNDDYQKKLLLCRP